jgi:hypothetical protein
MLISYTLSALLFFDSECTDKYVRAISNRELLEPPGAICPPSEFSCLGGYVKFTTWYQEISISRLFIARQFSIGKGY